MSHRTTHVRSAGALVAIGALVLAGCTPGGSDAAASSDVLVIAEPADTADVDPQLSFYDSSWRIQDMVYDSLVTTNAESEILPSIAESWTQEGNSYTFTLRDGVSFSNGRALTVDDVVGSLQRLIDPATGSYWGPQLGPVTAISAVDDRTVRVDLASTYTPFLGTLASTSAAILPIEELEAGTFDPAADFLGTGPYQVDSHTQDQDWKLSANPDYWDADNTAITSITVKIVPDDSARVAGLRNGSIDIGYFSSPDATALLDGIPNVETTIQGSSDAYWLLLNTVAPDSPFVDIDQRRALATSINREGLIETALGGSGEPTAVTPAGLPGACTPDGLATYDADPEAAAALLSEAGLEPASFSLMAPPYLSSFESIAQYIQQDATAAGFDASIETPEMGAYVDRVYSQNPSQFDGVIDYFSGYLSPALIVRNLLIDPAVPSVMSGFTAETPGLAEALDIAVSTEDEAVAAEALETACQLVADQANIVPLATKSTTIGVRTDRIDASIPTFDGYDIYLRNLTTYTLAE